MWFSFSTSLLYEYMMIGYAGSREWLKGLLLSFHYKSLGPDSYMKNIYAHKYFKNISKCSIISSLEGVVISNMIYHFSYYTTN